MPCSLLLTGPNELAIYHADAFQLTEGYGTRCTKPDFDDIMYPDYSLVFTRNKRVHDARRNVWSRATSQKCEQSPEEDS